MVVNTILLRYSGLLIVTRALVDFVWLPVDLLGLVVSGCVLVLSGCVLVVGVGVKDGGLGVMGEFSEGKLVKLLLYSDGV